MVVCVREKREIERERGKPCIVDTITNDDERNSSGGNSTSK